ncbi:MAG: hypothetical protein ACFB9M_18620 [Myxococcota bacterium]
MLLPLRIMLALALPACDGDLEGLRQPVILAPSTGGLEDLDVEAVPPLMRTWVFGEDALPVRRPDQVLNGIHETIFEELAHVQRTDLLRFELDYGLTASVYVFHPDVPNRILVLYQLGHQGLTAGVATVASLTAWGYTVLLHAMPFYGPDAESLTVSVPEGTFVLSSHDSLLQLDRHGYRTFQLFFEPISRSRAHVQSRQSFDQVVMLGLSGGGWTTDLYSILDPTLSASYSVAGSMPFSMRERPDIGDFEQLRSRDIYDLANFEAIYVLAAVHGRHRQILNQFDDCCFAWDEREDEVRAYESRVQERLIQEGIFEGFEVHLLPNRTRHDIHPEALELMDDELRPSR